MLRAPLTRTGLTLFLLVAAGLCASAPAAAWPSDPTTGVPVAALATDQVYPAAVSDGAGGLLVTWQDHRSSGSTGWDIYAMRLTKAGANYPGWPANGLLVCNATDDQTAPVIATDGAGGAIIAWQDHRAGNWDIYGQRITGAGVVAPGWPANGMVLGNAAPSGIARDELGPVIAPDGAGGAFAAWTLTFSVGTDYDIYGNHVTAGGTIAAGWTSTGTPIDAIGAIQNAPSICSDGGTGVYIVYQDHLAGNYDIHARHLGATNALIANVTVDNSAGDQTEPIARPDGAGGLYVAYNDQLNNLRLLRCTSALNLVSGWSHLLVTTNGPGSANPVDLDTDGSGGSYLTWTQFNGIFYDLYVQHILTDATLHPTWPSAGIPLPNGISYSYNLGADLVADGAGGVIAVYATGTGHISAIRYAANGGVPGGWSSNGTAVCTAYGSQSGPVAAGDGGGGMLVAWGDLRGGDGDIYANRVEHFGKLGSPEPVSAGVKDVRNDQGGQVRVNWLASYLDADPLYGIYSYVVYRQAPSALAQQALAGGTAEAIAPADTATLRAGVRDATVHRRYLVMPDAAQTTYWEQVATVPAQALPAYSLVAATTGDSVGASNPYTLFMVEALGYSGGYWFTAADSGYSVDNLAPVAPAPFAGTYVPGNATFLTWGPNAEGDLAGYRLYRGGSAGFVPGPSNLVAAQATTGFTDVGAPLAVYKLSAVDIHGNESAFAYLQPAGTTDAPGPTPPREVFLAHVAPNPVRGAAALRFGLPRDAVAELALFDSQGRRVRVLAEGSRAAGEYGVRWDGRDDAGNPVASGLYFLRLSTGGRTLTQRLVNVR